MKINLGFGLLLAVLLISGFAVVAFLLVPAWLTRRLPRGANVRSWLVYFVCLGLAYILVEIAFIQKFVLFLGHPTYGLSVAVLALLLSSALGSYYSQRWPEEWLGSRVSLLLGILAIVVLALGLLVVPLATRFVWLPLWQRMLLAAGLLSLPGFMMGIPFPSGLRLVRLSHPAALEWAWTMNAAASVLGSGLAVFISVHFGIWQTTAAGALCYAAAAALLALSATAWRSSATLVAAKKSV